VASLGYEGTPGKIGGHPTDVKGSRRVEEAYVTAIGVHKLNRGVEHLFQGRNQAIDLRKSQQQRRKKLGGILGH
jgi:hypothetical protein